MKGVQRHGRGEGGCKTVKRNVKRYLFAPPAAAWVWVWYGLGVGIKLSMSTAKPVGQG